MEIFPVYLIVVVGVVSSCSAQQNTTLPLELEVVRTSTCPSSMMRETIINDIQNTACSLLGLAPSGFQPPCACGNSCESWTRIAFLNMSDPSEQCPTSWDLVSTPVRGCRRPQQQTASCEPVSYSSNGRSYSRVCGRLYGYQQGSPAAFEPSFGSNVVPLDNPYIDGVSITHGAPGSRQHIWSFVAATNEETPLWGCACTFTNQAWNFQVPSFVGNDYFCATGHHGSGYTTAIYPNDVLWDGVGCGPTNACCTFNSPPWFCKTLPQPTTDDLEVRICMDQGNHDEDVVVSLVDIYVS